VLGEIEEYFAETLTPGDTFIFAGKVLRFEGITENEALCSRAARHRPENPLLWAASFRSRPISPTRCARCWPIPRNGARCPSRCATGCMPERKSRLPKRDELLIETFPRGSRFYMVAYPFEGRLAHQTLGMLLTRRLERAGCQAARLRRHRLFARDLGAGRHGRDDRIGKPQPRRLFDEDMLGDDLETWLAESFLMKRTFRNCAVIAGLIERRHPGKEKSGRQVTVSTDLIYDVLSTHEPDHILLQATRGRYDRRGVDALRGGFWRRQIQRAPSSRP
jgi:ATP-dependent Lhr-like helicase